MRHPTISIDRLCAQRRKTSTCHRANAGEMAIRAFAAACAALAVAHGFPFSSSLGGGVCDPGGSVWDACAPASCAPTPGEPHGATCGGRIQWLESSAGGSKSEADAKAQVAVPMHARHRMRVRTPLEQVASEFPKECGACAAAPPTPPPTPGRPVCVFDIGGTLQARMRSHLCAFTA